MERLPVALKSLRSSSPSPAAVRPKEAARLIGVSYAHFKKLLRTKRIPSHKDGTARLILREDLFAYVKNLPDVAPKEAPTGPLLSAVALPPEPPPKPAPEPEPGPAPDLAAIYFERLRLLTPGQGPDEGRLRSFEYTVGVCRRHYHVDLETAKRMTADAIKSARTRITA
jgi:excisionase family DNA binding protein